MSPDHAAALAMLDLWDKAYPDTPEWREANAKIGDALPELAEAWRKGVELRRCAFEVRAIGDFDTYCHSELVKAELAFDAALAAVAEKLTQGEPK